MIATNLLTEAGLISAQPTRLIIASILLLRAGSATRNRFYTRALIDTSVLGVLLFSRGQAIPILLGCISEAANVYCSISSRQNRDKLDEVATIAAPTTRAEACKFLNLPEDCEDLVLIKENYEKTIASLKQRQAKVRAPFANQLGQLIQAVNEAYQVLTAQKS